MKFWPFPMHRLYPTSKPLTQVFLAFAEAADLVLHEPRPLVDSHFHTVSCALGELRFWSANEYYAWASEGALNRTTFLEDDARSWKDEMPSRWAVKQMRERIAVLERVLNPRFSARLDQHLNG